MSLSHTCTAAVICCLALGGLVPVGAQTPHAAVAQPVVQDPAEVYLTAYRLCRESERLAQQQNYNAAINRGNQAEKVLAGIVKNYPGWKSNLVATRRRLLAENLAVYRQKVKDAPIPTGRQPGKPLSMEAPRTTVAPLPVAPSSGEARVPSSTPGTYTPIELPDYETTDRRLYNALALAQEECRRMAVAYRELNQKFEDVQRKLISAQTEQKMYKERYETLQQQVTSERAAGNRVVDSLSRQLAEMEAKYRASEEARQQAESRVSELETTLARTQEELERVTRERDALKAENEQLRAIVALNSPEKTKALLDQNLSLDQQLKDVQARVAELEAKIAGSDDQQSVLQQQLQDARAEADRLRDEMSGIYEENMGYRRRVSDLNERLTNLEVELQQQENKPVVDPALAEENKLLREVIAKQKRTIAMQEEGRRLLIETYKQIKNQDPAMLNALQRLDDESSLDLTDAERRIMDAVKGTEKGEKEAADAVREGLEVEALANLAAKAFSKGRYTAAEQLYRTLYDSNPEHVAGLVNLGTILLYRNKCREALEFLNRAERLAPDLAISYYLAGICHYRLDELDKAAVFFARTVELDPGNAEAFFYLANIEGVSGKYELALKHFAAAVKLKPGLGDAHYNMSRLYAETKRIPDAARAYDRAIANGAEPDPEFENYLRNHPDNANKPGDDLIATIDPEAEAAALRQNDPQIERIVQNREDEQAIETVDPVEPETDEPVAETDAPGEPGPPAEQPDQPEQPVADADAQPAEPQPEPDPFTQRIQQVRQEVKDAPTPSSAGAGHELDEKNFRTIRVRTKRMYRPGRYRYNRVKLRLKRSAPQRLRKRGGEVYELKKEK